MMALRMILRLLVAGLATALAWLVMVASIFAWALVLYILLGV